MKKCDLCPPPDDTPVPADLGPGSWGYGIHELIRLNQPDLFSLFTGTTGGRTLSFLKKHAREQAIQLVGEKVHRQHILTFEPKGGDAGKFHTVRVEVKNRPEFQGKTREGYWQKKGDRHIFRGGKMRLSPFSGVYLIGSEGPKWRFPLSRSIL
jgi:hypothetical protein